MSNGYIERKIFVKNAVKLYMQHEADMQEIIKDYNNLSAYEELEYQRQKGYGEGIYDLYKSITGQNIEYDMYKNQKKFR